jgi:HSP20 family protein
MIRWEPVAELGTIQNEMNRLFNTFFEQPAGRGDSPTARRWIPPMDLIETGDSYVVCADLPGISEEDLTIQLEDNVLTISGVRNPEHARRQDGHYRLERAFGAFSRSLTLPDGIDPDAVRARVDRGVLQVEIPKPEQKKPRQVQIAIDSGHDTQGAVVQSGESSGSSQPQGAAA